MDQFRTLWRWLGHISQVQWLAVTALSGVPVVLGVIEGIPLAFVFALALAVFVIALIGLRYMQPPRHQEVNPNLEKDSEDLVATTPAINAPEDPLANHVVTRVPSIYPPAPRPSQRDRPAAFRISPEANIGDLDISGSVFIGSGDFVDNQGKIGRMKVDKTIVLQPTGKGEKPDDKR
jgi:hypothetical protein